MRKARTLLVLLGMAALVGGLLVWDRAHPGTDGARRARGKLDPGFDRARLSELDIERGGKTVTLRRDGDAWSLDGGCRAEPTLVDELLGELDFGEVERRVAHPSAALDAELGLAHPRATLRAGGLTFRVGADAPGGNGVYVARSDDPEVLVVERRFLDVLDHAPDEWRSMRLTLREPDQAGALAIGDLALRRVGSGFSLEKPIASRADPRAVDALLQAIDRIRGRARATSAHSGHASGGLAISIDGREEARLIGPCPGTPGATEVARADGLDLCFADDALQKVRVTADALRERRLFPLDLDAVNGLDLEAGGRVLRLRRAQAAWRIVAPLDAAGPADDGAVRAFIRQLLALTADGHGPPGAKTATVRLLSDADTVTVDFSAPSGGRVRALRQGEGDALLLPAPPAGLFDPSPLRVRDRRIFNLRADDLSELRVVDHGSTVTLDRIRRAPSPDGWRATPAASVQADAIEALIEALAELRTDGYRAGARLTSPARRILARVDGAPDGGTSPPSLAIAAPDAGGCLAEAPGLPPFRLPRATCDLLLAPLVRPGR